MTTEATLSPERGQMGLVLPNLEIDLGAITPNLPTIRAGVVVLGALVAGLSYNAVRSSTAGATELQAEEPKVPHQMSYGPTGNRTILPIPIQACPDPFANAERVKSPSPVLTSEGVDSALQFRSATVSDTKWYKYGYGCVDQRNSAFIDVYNGQEPLNSAVVSVQTNNNKSGTLLENSATVHGIDGSREVVCDTNAQGGIDCQLGDIPPRTELLMQMRYSSKLPAAQQGMVASIGSRAEGSEGVDQNPSNNTATYSYNVHPKFIPYNLGPTISTKRSYWKRDLRCRTDKFLFRAKPDNKLYGTEVSVHVSGLRSYRKSLHSRLVPELTPNGYAVPIRICKKDVAFGKRPVVGLSFSTPHLENGGYSRNFRWSKVRNKFVIAPDL